MIGCADGSESTCTGRCVRNEDGSCGWQVIVECGSPDPCADVPQCDFLCPEGTHNVLDDNGCETCQCEADGDGGSAGGSPR